MTTVRGVLQKQGELVQIQSIRAAAMLLLPAFAIVVAIFRGCRNGVEVWEVMLLMGMYMLTMIGMTLGLHRMLSHRSFRATRSLRIVLAVLGAMAGQGPPIYWAVNHRRHHAYTDSTGDLHSPHRNGQQPLEGLAGFWHAHIGWMFGHELTNTAHFGRDLLQDRDLVRVNRYYYLWVLVGLAVPAALGFAVKRTMDGAIDGLLWGGGIRMFLSYQFVAAVNSILHAKGSRRFNTSESSRNNFWLALPTLGEAWHNNHHANPHSANFGCAWWEFDIGWWVIAVLRRIGFVQHVAVTHILQAARVEQTSGVAGEEDGQ